MTLLLRDIVPGVIGAICGGWLVTRLQGRNDEVPASVVAVWRSESGMTEGQRKLRVIRRGDNAIKDIKTIRKVYPQFSIRGAKYIVDHVPQVVSAGLSPEEAEAMKQRLESSGMIVEVSY